MPLTHSKKPDQYLVHHQGQVQGPFDGDFIEAMIMSGVYPSTVLVEASGTSERRPFSDFPKHSVIPPRGLDGPPSHTPKETLPVVPAKKTKPEAVVAQVLGVIFVLVVIGIITIAASSKEPPKPGFVSSPSSPPSTNAYSPPAPTSPSIPSPKLATSSAPTPPAKAMVYRDASGRTYSVSNSDYYRLSGMQTALSLKQSGMNAEETRLKLLGNEVDREKNTLDRYSQYAVDDFNRKVNQVNALNSRVQSLVDEYNRGVNAFNTELERVGTPIN